MKSAKRGGLLSNDVALWKIESQVDAINRHAKIALSLVRKELKREERKKVLMERANKAGVNPSRKIRLFSIIVATNTMKFKPIKNQTGLRLAPP